jgi:hypothetical protein
MSLWLFCLPLPIIEIGSQNNQDCQGPFATNPREHKASVSLEMRAADLSDMCTNKGVHDRSRRSTHVSYSMPTASAKGGVHCWGNSLTDG